jgi:hypothetical protein
MFNLSSNNINNLKFFVNSCNSNITFSISFIIPLMKIFGINRSVLSDLRQILLLYFNKPYKKQIISDIIVLIVVIISTVSTLLCLIYNILYLLLSLIVVKLINFYKVKKLILIYILNKLKSIICFKLLSINNFL